MSEATVVQLHLQQPSGSTKLDDLRKKQIRSIASIHPLQTNTNYLTRIYNRTIPYLEKIPTESRTIIVLEAKEARDHDLEKSGLPRGI